MNQQPQQPGVPQGAPQPQQPDAMQGTPSFQQAQPAQGWAPAQPQQWQQPQPGEPMPQPQSGVPTPQPQFQSQSCYPYSQQPAFQQPCPQQGQVPQMLSQQWVQQGSQGGQPYQTWPASYDASVPQQSGEPMPQFQPQPGVPMPQQSWSAQGQAPSQGWAPAQPQQWQQPQPGAPVAPQPMVGKQKPHSSYVWLGSLQAAIGIIVAGAIAGFTSVASVISEGGVTPFDALFVGGIVFGIFVVIVAICVGYLWWSYKHIWFELGDEEFSLYSGIFNKKHVHVPYRRVQSVDQRASLLQRIFGVCSVSIDTAGGSNNKAVSVPYLRKAQAEQLRAELFARKNYLMALDQGVAQPNGAAAAAQAAQPVPGNVLDAPAELWQEVGGVFAGNYVDTGRVTYEYGMTNKELVLTGLTNNTAFVLVVIGLIAGAGQLVGSVDAFVPGASDVMVGAADTALRLFGGSLVAAVAFALFIAAAVVWGLSALGSIVSYGGFKARRRDNRIEVEHGLLQHRFQGVDVDRVQSVVVKQGFIRRLFGYCQLSLGKIDAVSDEDAQQQSGMPAQGLVIHPFVKIDRVPGILAGIIPEFADVPQEPIALPKVALRRALVRRVVLQGDGFWLAVICALGQLGANAVLAGNASPEAAVALGMVNAVAPFAYALCVLFAVLDAIGAVLWFRGSSFAFNRRFMQVTNGGFSRESVTFPRKKIQFGHTRTNPFQRRACTATVLVRTAAGVGGTTTRLIDAPADAADAWLEWLEPRR